MKTEDTTPHFSLPRRQRRRRRFRRNVLLGLGFVLLPLLAALIVADYHGLPAPLAARLERGLTRSGLPIRFERLRFGLVQGLVADQPLLFADEARTRLLFEAGQVRIIPDFAAGFRGDPWVRRIEVSEARLPVGAFEDAQDFVRHLSFVLTFGRHEVRVEGLRGEIEGLQIGAKGRIVLPADPPEAKGGRDRRSADRTSPPARALAGASEYLRGLEKKWSALARPTLEGPARVHLDFLADLARPEQTYAQLRAEGEGLRHWGLVVQGWKLEGRWSGTRLESSRLDLRTAAGELRVEGSLDWGRKVAEARASGAIPAAWIHHLPLPAEAAARLRRVGVQVPGALEVEWSSGGERAWADLAQRFSGRLRHGPGEIFGVPIESMNLRYEREGERWRFQIQEAVLGRGAESGPLKGEIELWPADGRFTGRMEAAFAPNILQPLFNPMTSRELGAVAWRGPMPRIQGTFSGCVKDIRQLVLEGQVDARQLSWHGAQISACRGYFAVSNEVMRLNGIEIVRPEGAAAGWIEQDFRHGLVRFDLDSSLDPTVAARFAGPTAYRLIRRLRLEGPTLVQARGQVDYLGRKHHDVEADVDAQRIGLRWFLAERAAFHLSMKGPRVEISEARGFYCGGGFDGKGAFVLPEAPGQAPAYELQFRLRDADFTRVVHELWPAGTNQFSGRMSGELTLAGRAGAGQGPTAAGQGKISIREGHLMSVPLFGGLSRMLDHVSKGLARADLSEFQADFTVGESRITTANAVLQGSVINMRADGALHFNQRLKFVVQVRPLREGWLAEIVRPFTFPLTKLFEFDLSGNPREPVWEPRNLPKELFLKF